MEFHEDPGWQPRRRAPSMYYRCPACHTEITFARVEELGQIDGDVFHIAHKCECCDDTFSYMCQVEHSALLRLLGGFRPVLPYRAAPNPSFILRPAMEKQILLFAWDVTQLADVDEFLLFCGGPTP